MQTQESLFESALADHKQSLARIVATYEMNPGLQQELHQEILLAIWKSLANFRGDSSLHTFIFKVAHNTAINHVSKHVKLPNHESLDEPLPSNMVEPEMSAINNQKMQML